MNTTIEPYTTLINYNSSEEDSEHETEYTTNTTEYSSSETNQTENTKVSCCTLL